MRKFNNTFKMEEISFIGILDSYPNLTYIDINKFIKNDKYSGKEDYDYKIIEKELNENSTDINQEIIVVDKNLIEILAEFVIKKIQRIDSKSRRDTLLYSINNEDNDAMKVDQKTENYLIELLVPNQKDKWNYSIWDIDNQRNCIPAFSKYDLLAVKTIPAGIAFYKHNQIRQMISPITRRDKQRIKSFNDKESFVESIVTREDYKKLLNYTMKNRNSEKPITEKEISELYKELIGKYFELIKIKLNQGEKSDASLK